MNKLSNIFAILLIVSFFACPLTAKVRYDFDGDGKTDPTLIGFDNLYTQMFWHTLGSTSGYSVTAWGSADIVNSSFSDWAAAADYDGDGKTDVAVWREPNPQPRPPQGDQAYFYILYSSTNTYAVLPWGRSRNNSYEDFPIRGDFDGDGREDVAIVRQLVGGQSGNYFYIQQSRDGLRIERFGNTGDALLQGDFDGDGKTDVGVARPQCLGAGCQFDYYIKRSSDGNWLVKTFGFYSSDYPLSNVDFDGDGKSDIAIWSGKYTEGAAGNGRWTWIRSSDGAFESVKWGFNEVADAAAPGDYDGDGKTDLAVYRRNTFSICNVPSYFWIRGSTMGVKVIQFGSCHDHPFYND
jgi:hypothetical protein